MVDVKINTEIDSSGLDDFVAVFEKFAKLSGGTRETWQGLADDVKSMATVMRSSADDIRALRDHFDDAAQSTRKLGDETERVSRRWTVLARGTRDVAGHVKGATESLLKWAGVAGLVAGVAGFGGEHLMMGLGRTVSSNRSTAMGLGTTYGGLAATRLGYERYGDGQALLGNIADAQNDPAKRLPFGALGMGARDYEGRDTADVAADVMRRAKDVLDRVPDDQLGSRLRVTHLDEFFTLEDARRIKHDSREEVRGQADSIGRNRRDLELDAKTQRQWQDFTTQMGRAGATIEAILVNRLVALEPGLLALSDAATKIAAALLAKDGPVDQWLGELNTGLEWLATSIDKPEFQKQVRDFFEGLVDLGRSAWGLAKGAAGLLHWLAKLTGDAVVAPAEAATNGAGDGAGGGASGMVGLRAAARTQEHPLVSGGRRRFMRENGIEAPDPIGNIGAMPAENARLAAARKGFFDELNRDPKLRRDVIKTASEENDGSAASLQTVIESMANRGMMRGQHSFRDVLGLDHPSRSFYGPIRTGALRGALSAKDRAEGEKALSAVAAGGNLIDYRTDQGMLTDPGALRYMASGGDHSGHAKVQGEHFFYMGPEGRAFAERQRQLDAAAKTTVTVDKNPGGNPSATAALAAAPQ